MKDFIQLLKLPPSILAAIVLGTGSILFLPANILKRLGLDNLPEQWRTILGLTLIITSSLLIISFIIKASKIFVPKLYEMRIKKKFPEVMRDLRNAELEVVALLYRSPSYTSRLPYSNGVTLRLVKKLVIKFTSERSVAYGDDLLMPFTITPMAQEYIDKHPEMIEKFSKSDLQQLYHNYNNPLW